MSDRLAFYGGAGLLFAASLAGTIIWCGSMSSMGDMPMPGGWRMPMMWMLMPGQSWLGAGSTFLGMWAVMMVAMMLPSVLPMLARYRAAVQTTAAVRRERLTAVAGCGYFAVWIALGAIVFPLGIAVAAIEMQSPAAASVVPLVAGTIVAVAGVLQFSAWKAHLLACCAAAPSGDALRADLGAAWRHGVRLGVHCVRCCAGLTAILIVMGVMDLRIMAGVTVAIALERLLPAGERLARATGSILVVAGLLLIVRAAG